MLSKPITAECARNLHHPAQKTVEQTCAPRPGSVMGLLINRAHDQKYERDDAWRINPVRQGGDIAASGLMSQSAGLPRVENIPDEDRQGGAWQNAFADEVGGKTAYTLSKHRNHHQLQKIIQEQAEEPVNVSSNEQRDLHDVRGLKL